jgi:peptidoglycan/LPS O-acetylase OafA/YrhL
MNISQFNQFDTIKIDNKNNAFDFVRLVLALFVVFAHSRYLYGAPDILNWQAKYFDNLHAGNVALWGFFAISGYLVTLSWQRSSGIVDFVIKRYKRIFPGYWMSVLVCGLFFIPFWYFIKEKTMSGFWVTNGLDIWKFLSSYLDAHIKVSVVGAFSPDYVNGPWWTIHHELRGYLFLGVLGFFGFIQSSKRYLILGLTVFLNLVRIHYSFNPEFANFYRQWFGDERLLLFGLVFMWGVSLNLFKDLVPLKWSGLLISLAGLVLGTSFDFLPILLPFCFTYLILSLCYVIPIRNISNKIGDLSYGIYLYHWPVRTTLQLLGFQSALGLWPFLGLNLLATLPLAFLSWNLVEKRFLARHKAPSKVEPKAEIDEPSLQPEPLVTAKQ